MQTALGCGMRGERGSNASHCADLSYVSGREARLAPLLTSTGSTRRLIEALQKNGREPFRRIAADVGVSEATIRARYTRLCEDNILQVTGVTNPLGLGFDAIAMVGIRTAGAPEPVADAISRWDEAGYVVVTAGQFDILVELVCADRRQLLDVTNRMRELDGVVSTESFLYLELWKQLYDWGARAQNGARVPVR